MERIRCALEALVRAIDARHAPLTPERLKARTNINLDYYAALEDARQALAEQAPTQPVDLLDIPAFLRKCSEHDSAVAQSGDMVLVPVERPPKSSVGTVAGVNFIGAQSGESPGGTSRTDDLIAELDQAQPHAELGKALRLCAILERELAEEKTAYEEMRERVVVSEALREQLQADLLDATKRGDHNAAMWHASGRAYETAERDLTALRNIATDALEYIEQYADITYEGKGPNRAMSLAAELRSVLGEKP